MGDGLHLWTGPCPFVQPEKQTELKLMTAACCITDKPKAAMKQFNYCKHQTNKVTYLKMIDYSVILLTKALKININMNSKRTQINVFTLHSFV